MRPLYVESDHLSPDRIGYVRYELEAALSIGAYRLPTSTTNLAELKENAAIYHKIAATAEHAYRDVMARIAWLENQEEQRRLAAAHTSAPAPLPQAPAAQPRAAAPKQCMCGDTSAPYTVHRQEAPCYRVDNPPCQTCQGNGCPNCAGHGIAVVNPPQEPPAGKANALQLVHDGRAPMPSTASFNPPTTRAPAPAPGQ
ncbi:hypothetical protein ACFLIM_38925 [Nonomuraea sp. M3C6]|uniref:Uncharacterized protein n=1 Tax=Nonomuraea marmarensis TaxID=3351344 RepID=A0ABW7AP44_9ACTN